ncbi:hypothetical protein FRB96_008555 [Tulasnella sp. 330]|nr:hypothetical protein FRB96_008555 [Tulasnella sp. 330]
MSAMDADTLSNMKHSDLQALAKKHNIRANLKGEQIIEKLLALQPRTRRPTRPASKADPSRPGLQARKASVARSRPVASRVDVVEETTESPEQSGDEDDQGDDADDKIMLPPPPPSAKARAKEIQRRLGVGRPIVAGGSGARKSTAKSKTPLAARWVPEVVVPSMSLVHEEAERRASRRVASAGGSNQPHAQRMISGVGSDTLNNAALTMMMRALEDRVDKAEKAFAKERRKRMAQEEQTQNLAVELEELRRQVEELRDARGSDVDRATVENKISPRKGKQKAIEPMVISSPQRHVINYYLQLLPVPHDATPSRQATPRAAVFDTSHGTHEPSPFPPTPPSLVLDTPPSGLQSPAGKGSSRPVSPRLAAPTLTKQTQQALVKKAISRARAMSNQPMSGGQPIVSNTTTAPGVGNDSGDDSFHHPGKHDRDDTRGNSAAAPEQSDVAVANPKKKPRLEKELTAGDMDVDANTGDNAQQEDQEQNIEEVIPNEIQPTLPRFIATTAAKTGAENNAAPQKPKSRNPRASSQPAGEQPSTTTRAGRKSRASSKEPPVQRKTRAGSADVASASSSRKPPSGRGRTAAIPPTLQALGWTPYELIMTNGAGARAAVGANGDASQYAIPGPSATAAAVVTRPAPIAEESEGDDGEPPLLRPLTHFDSGIEFYGSISKQGYQSDWHEGLVLDDPIDAETLRRGQALLAEESIGGRYLNPPPPSATTEVEQAYAADTPVVRHPSEDEEQMMGELLGNVNFPMIPHHHGL